MDLPLFSAFIIVKTLFMRILILLIACCWTPSLFAQNILNNVKAKAQEKLENIGTKKKPVSDTAAVEDDTVSNNGTAKKDTTVNCDVRIRLLCTKK